MRVRLPWAGCVLAGVLLLALPAAGQLEIGNNLSMGLNGTLGGGYSADYANLFSSSHGLSGNGTATLSGSYYNPNFLSYSVTPYYGESRANSNYQSIFDSSGINVSTSLFSGSHFPGSINYAKSYNSEGNFGIPGVANYTTKGNGDTFGIAWAESIPNDPSLSVSFQRGGNDYSLFGSDQDGNSTFYSLNLHSNYIVDRFGLGAFYEQGASHALIPQVLGTQQEQPETVGSSNSGYGFTANRQLPMRGGFALAYTHSDFDTGLPGESYNGGVDLATSSVGFQPIEKLHFGAAADYSTSLTGQLYQQIVAAGGVAPAQNPSPGSHGLDVIGTAAYAIMNGLQSQGEVEHREQLFLGETYSSNSYSGSLMYTRSLLGGNFNAAATVRDSTVVGSSQNNLGFSTSVGYSRRVNNWGFNGSFSYAQDMETLLIAYNTSFYNYSGSIRHHLGLFTWSAGVGAGRTGLTVGGAENTNKSFTASMGYSHFLTLTSNYSKASGIGIETASGLVQNPVLVPVLTPGSAILFGGDSYSVGLGSNPARKLTIGAAYAKALSNTNFNSVISNSSTCQYNAVIQYQVRKLYVSAGYSRLQQGFNTSTTGPAVVSSFYFGVSRWFNFF